MAIASEKEILEHIESIDLNQLLDKMENYVRDRFYNKSDKEKKGFEYLDFCHNVILKVCEGVRKWDKDGDATFEEFIFGSLRSDLYNYFRKQKNNTNSNLDEETCLIEINEYSDLDILESEEKPPDLDFDEICKDTLLFLKEQGANKLEIEIFECWLEGYSKPQEIAELCNTNTADINNAIKRLSKKTVKLKKKWISLKN